MSYTVTVHSSGAPETAPVLGTIVMDGAAEDTDLNLGFIPSKIVISRKIDDSTSTIIEGTLKADGTYSGHSTAQTGARSWATAAIYFVAISESTAGQGVTVAAGAGQASTDDLVLFEAHR